MNTIERAINWLTDPTNWNGQFAIPERLGEHLGYSGLALLIATVIAVPIGLIVGHTGRGALLAVNLAGAVRAIPTLGVLILVVTLVGLGLLPVMVALVALAIPPILVNTCTGIETVDRELKDAARGMGMQWWQRLLQVEFPVALPLVLLGMRTAAIQIVSTATIAAYVGLGGLGRYIFDGLAQRNFDDVLGGAVFVAVLAVLAEVLFFLVQRIVTSPGVRNR